MGIKGIPVGVAVLGMFIIIPLLPAQETKQEKPAIETKEETKDAKQKKCALEVSGRVDFLGKYLLRGMVFDDKPVMQPTVSLGYKGFTVRGLVNYSFAQGKISEFDPNLEYSRDMGHGMNAAVGYYAYHLFGWDIARGQEVYATLSRQQLLNPSFQVVYSWEYGEGWYAELGISEAVPIWKQKLNLSSKLGFNIHYFRETTGFSHVELKAEMPYKVKKITIYPSVNFSLGLAKEFNNTFYIGLGIGLQRTVIN